MFYVIQTNTSLNNCKEPRDFQSAMYKIGKHTWEEFKEYILSNSGDFTEKSINGTIIGHIKPKNCIIENVLINDDKHLEIIIKYEVNTQLRATNIKLYKVSEYDFLKLL
ncbi:hypothetical protein FCV38_02630 [Clostridium sporogenes]|nr:hypothetical protein [Clostridium sporogenes]